MAADSIVTLMHSLMRSPAALVSMQQILGAEHIKAFQHIAVLAKRYVEARNGSTEATVLEDQSTPSTGTDG